MPQTKEEIEKFYEQEDPWGYETHPDDDQRQRWILGALDAFPFFRRALDIGMGEGWLTINLPAVRLNGIELSDEAAARANPDIQRVSAPDGKYDLVIATGVLYPHYNIDQMLQWIDEAADGIILTCHSQNLGDQRLPYEQIFYAEFPYKDTKQIMRVYDRRLS